MSKDTMKSIFLMLQFFTYLGVALLALYGGATRPDGSWRSGVPYLALLFAAGLKARGVIEHKIINVETYKPVVVQREQEEGS